MSESRAVPTSVKVFGILHIIFGSFSLVTGLAGLGSLDQSLTTLQQFGISGFALDWMRITSYLAPILALALLILGIGLLMKKSWGRSGSVIYSYIAIALAILNGIIIGIGFSGATGPNGEGGGAFAIGAMVGALVGSVVGMIYPILTIIFMNKENVKTALAERG